MGVHPGRDRRARQPFIGLAGAGAAGILAGAFLRVEPVASLTLLALAAFAIFLRVRGSFWLSVSMSFMSLHVLRTHDRPAEFLAEALGRGTRSVQITGQVLARPEAGATEDRWRFPVRTRELAAAGGRRIEMPCDVLVRMTGSPPAYGDVVRIAGTLRNVPPPRNPGEFDYAAWLRLHGIRSELFSHGGSGLVVLSHGGSPLIHWALAARDWIAAALRAGIEVEAREAAVIEAMTLGLESGAPEDIQTAFRETGTLHLFSVSGLHVAMIAAILWFVLSVAGVSKRAAVVVILPILFFYALITGAASASVRAAIMIAVILAGHVVERRPLPLNSLGAAAFLIMLWNTNELFSPGFQLSFVVVAAILLLGVPLQRSLRAAVEPDPFLPRQLVSSRRQFLSAAARAVIGPAAISFAALLGSLPLVAWYFHLVTPAALLANVVAIPLAFAVLALAMLSVASGAISLSLAAIVNHSNLLATQSLLAVVSWFASLPGAYFYVAMPQIDAPPVRIVVFDCGAGGSAAIHAHGRQWMIDCGPPRFAAGTVVPYLHSRGVNRLDGMVLTHGDAGHLGGAIQTIEEFRPVEVAESVLDDRSRTRNHVGALLREIGIAPKRLAAGDVVSLSTGVSLHILYPPRFATAPFADDKTLVARLDAAGTRVLFTSDAGISVESWLVSNQPEAIRCDILVKGQHVSGISGDNAFLRAASPRVIVASSAAFPRTERLPDAWVQRLSRLEIELFRQDDTGAVTIDVWERGFDIRGFLDGRRSFRFARSP